MSRGMIEADPNCIARICKRVPPKKLVDRLFAE